MLHRAIRVVLNVWLLTVSLWTFFPSPRRFYAQEALQSTKTSKTLTVVDSDPIIYQNSTESHASGYFIHHWQIATQLNQEGETELTLKASENKPINLADLMKKKTQYRVSPTMFDSTTLEFELPWVDDIESCDICLPFFDDSDNALFYQQTRGDTRTISVRIVVEERDVLGIWPASFVDHALAELDKLRRKPGAADYEDAMWSLRETVRPIIQLKGGDMKQLEQLAVSYVRGDLPSKTYPIRKAALTLLGPALHIAFIPVLLIKTLFSVVPKTLSIVLYAVFIVLDVGVALCMWIMLSAWLRAGRPDFLPWTRTYWMTRWMYGTSRRENDVWGPAGPVVSTAAAREEWVGNGIVELQGPKNARLDRGSKAV